MTETGIGVTCSSFFDLILNKRHFGETVSGYRTRLILLCSVMSGCFPHLYKKWNWREGWLHKKVDTYAFYHSHSSSTPLNKSYVGEFFFFLIQNLI